MTTRPIRRWLVLAICLPMLMGMGPCGPIPGGELSGDVVTAPVDDWSFANDVPRCAVEVRPASPHSVTVNCMSWQQRLFVSCSECELKRWSGGAMTELMRVDEPRPEGWWTFELRSRPSP